MAPLNNDSWPIFVISLLDASQRRENITRQLNNCSLPFTIMDAIDGRNGLPMRYEHLIDRDPTRSKTDRQLADGEYACALSHMAVYHHICDNNLQGAIVLEDDAILTPLFSEFMDTRGYNKADLVQLDHSGGRIWRLSKKQRLNQNIQLVVAASNATLTTGYSISRQGAEFILANSFPIHRTADWPCDLISLPVMLVLPRVVDHPDLATAASSLEAERSLMAGERVRKPKKRKSIRRIFSTSYWRRWWFKRGTCFVS
jgi:glycosyl transferase family 25